MLVILVAASQILLPGLAENRLQSSLEKNGEGVAVQVEAWPAIKLLLGHADDVTVTMDTAHTGGGSGGSSLGDLLARTSATTKLDVDVGELDAYGVLLQDVTLQKGGDLLSASATVRDSKLEAITSSAGLRFVSPDSPTQSIAFEGHMEAFGQRVEAEFELTAENGAIVVRPKSDALAEILSYPVFQDDRVYVDSLSGRREDGHLAFEATTHLVDG